MYNIPAKEFLDRFANAYGETWEGLFFGITDHPMCAKHMSELIEDIDEYGQQTPAFVDNDGLVTDGNRVAIALAILDKNINYEVANPPEILENQIYEVEFDLESGNHSDFRDHLYDIFSFRAGDEWVYPVDAESAGDSYIVFMYCPGGEITSNIVGSMINSRTESRGFSLSAIRVSPLEVDEDISEW